MNNHAAAGMLHAAPPQQLQMLNMDIETLRRNDSPPQQKRWRRRHRHQGNDKTKMNFFNGPTKPARWHGLNPAIMDSLRRAITSSASE